MSIEVSSRCRIALAGVLLAGITARAVEVKLSVTNDTGVAREASAVTSGIPFERGAVADTGMLSASADGKVLAAQFQPTSRWEDGTLRWVLMDTQVDVPANGRAEITVRDDGRNAPPPAPVIVKESGSVVTLETGGTVVSIDRGRSDFLSVALDGKPRLGGGRGLVVRNVVKTGEKDVRRGKAMVKEPIYEAGGEVVANPPASAVVEQAGPLRAVVAVRGTFGREVHKGLLAYTVRVTLCAGQRQAKLQVWIENNGAMGYYYKTPREGLPEVAMEWFLFDSLALELGLPEAASKVAGAGLESTSGKLRIHQTCHRNKDGRKMERGQLDIFSMKDFEYVVTAGAEELGRGERTDGVLRIEGAAGGLTTAMRDFWQNYDKAVEVDGANLRYWLWPAGGRWPRERTQNWSGLYDPRLENLPITEFYYLQGGMHKGHELILDFAERAEAESAADLSHPLFALASAGYYMDTGAVPALFAPLGTRTGDGEADAGLTSWENMYGNAADAGNPGGIHAAREQTTWSNVRFFHDSTYSYGWMDFGDISCPARGPNSLQHDWLQVMLVGAMRGGGAAFMRLATDMATHLIDVDQRWSDRDLPHVNKLQRIGSNFPAFHSYRLTHHPNVSDNYLGGMVLYALLTGDAKAREASLRNAEGLKAAWEHVNTSKVYGGRHLNMAAVFWTVQGYIAMQALTGDRSWVDAALALFNSNVVPKWKRDGPHLHRPKPYGSQGYAEDDIKFAYSIANLCLLHHATGDETVKTLILEACDTPFPTESFYKSPLFLADLFAYAALITGKEEYEEEAVERWNEAAPDSASPPVFEPNSSTWAREMPMNLRAGNILQYYFNRKQR